MIATIWHDITHFDYYRAGGLIGRYAGGGVVGNGLYDIDSVFAKNTLGNQSWWLAASMRRARRASTRTRCRHSTASIKTAGCRINKNGRSPSNDNSAAIAAMGAAVKQAIGAHAIAEISTLRDRFEKMQIQLAALTKATQRKTSNFKSIRSEFVMRVTVGGLGFVLSLPDHRQWRQPMSRISMTCISLAAAAVAFSASAANAGSVVVHTTMPNVKVQTPHIGSQTNGAGAGKVTFNPFHVTKTIDKSSNTLSQGVSSGKHYTAGKGGGATLYDDKQKGSNSGHDDMFLKLEGIEGESKDDTHKTQ